MAKVSELLSKAINAREVYNEFNELTKRCLDTFTHWDINEIESSLKNDWEELFFRFEIEYFDDENIFNSFKDLKSHIINRDQFKKRMEKTIKFIEEERDRLKEEQEKSEKDLLLAYNAFFEDSLKEHKESERIVYLLLKQPEITKVVMEFLKS